MIEPRCGTLARLAAKQNKWNPILCALMLNRAALDVHWSPSGKAGEKGLAKGMLSLIHI